MLHSRPVSPSALYYNPNPHYQHHQSQNSHPSYQVPGHQSDSSSYTMNGGPIRRMRQDASASPSPYPSQAVLRSSSFSGSDGHRSSSSDIEDGSGLVSTVPGNGLYGYHAHPGAVTQTAHPHSIYGQPPPQQHHDYSAAAAAMYAHPNRSHSGLSINSASTGHHSTIASMDVMSTGTVPGSGMSSMGAYGVPGRTMVPDQGLEQLAANVRAATTTSASDRAKHIFVQAWLNANYAPYQDGNVPRQGLYNSYRRVCDEYRIPHVNTATLGKAIRLCFPAIKTRRLGVRGNSKYHYCGIRPSTAAEAEWLQDFINRTNNNRNNNSGSRPNTAQSGRSGTSSAAEDDSPEDDDDEGNESSHGLPHLSLRNGGGVNGRRSPVYFSMTDDKTPTVGGFNAAQAQALGGEGGGVPSYASLRRRAEGGVVASNVGFPARAGSAGAAGTGGSFPGASVGTLRPGESVRQLKGFPDIEEAVGGQGPAPLLSDSASSTPGASNTPGNSGDAGSTQPSPTTPSASGAASAASPGSQFVTTAREVWKWFEEHLDHILDSVRNFRLEEYEMQVRSFWSGLGPDQREIVHAPAVAGLMARADALVYDEILEILRSQLLVTIPPHVLTGLRGLADKMEKMLLSALEGYGHTFVEPKVELGARFGHLVLRFLDIYQVTQALASVMSNPKQLSDMSRSWREVDFESVRNQAALVCNCRHEDLHQLLEVEFIQILDGLQSSAEPVRDIIVWAEQTSDRLIGASSGANSAAASAGGVGANAEERATMSSRSLLIRWGYVTSQIMRDLTIRSDPAFGAFQILKLFMDDWIALSVLRTVALSTNSVAASVEPAMQNPQFLALSPSGNHFATTNSHMSINAQMMAHTPTTASMMAAMGDFGGMSGLNASSHHGGAGAGYGFDSLSFGSAMDANTFDFTGASSGGNGLGSHGGVADSEMSSPADDLVKVEGGP